MYAEFRAKCGICVQCFFHFPLELTSISNNKINFLGAYYIGYKGGNITGNSSEWTLTNQRPEEGISVLKSLKEPIGRNKLKHFTS